VVSPSGCSITTSANSHHGPAPVGRPPVDGNAPPLAPPVIRGPAVYNDTGAVDALERAAYRVGQVAALGVKDHVDVPAAVPAVRGG